MNKPELTITDGSAILWVVNWPTKASVIDYLQNLNSFILQKLAAGNTSLAFDRCYDCSIKSSTRSGCGRSTCRTQINTGSENKSQLIELIFDRSHMLFASNAVFFNYHTAIPRQVQNGLIIERTNLSTTQEEADVIILQQAY